MKFPWGKKSSSSRSARTKHQVGHFAVGDYVSRRPQPTKPPKGLYRRGSTRSGSTKYGIKKLNKESVNDATPRERLRHLQNLRTRIIFGQWISIILAVVLFVISYNFTASVHINLSGDGDMRVLTADERDDYTSAVQSYLRDNPIERIAFMLDSERLRHYLTDEYAEVRSISPIGVSGVGQHTFNVELRRPVASWRMSGETFFVDSSGVAFRKNFYDSPGVDIVDNSGARSDEGDVLISSSFLRFVGRAIAFSADRGYTITEATIPPLAFRQIEFTVEEVPYKVLMTTVRDAGVQVEDMDNAIQYFMNQGRNPNYIDVRVEGMAFFRD